jgi:hydroxyacylglutathione hydrolase
VREIVSQVYLLEGLRGGNVYLAAAGTEPTLIDSGMPGDGQRIEAQLEEVGYALTDLRYIVLTHAHLDHVGSVARLADRSGAQVLAHRDEVPYIQERKPMPATSGLRRLLN